MKLGSDGFTHELGLFYEPMLKVEQWSVPFRRIKGNLESLIHSDRMSLG